MTDDEMRVVIESLYDAKVSKSYVSSVTDAVLDDVEAFRKAPMPSDIFCLYLDSTYVPLRRGTVQKETVNIAMAIDAEGRKTVLGYSITPEESAKAYGELLESFASRGLRRVEIVVSDFVAISKAADRNGAATLLRGFRDKWGSRYPSVRRWLERTEGIITFMDYPAEIRRLIYTNNPIESMNKHIKRELK